MVTIAGVVLVAVGICTLLAFKRYKLFLIALIVAVLFQNPIAMVLLRIGVVPIQDGIYLLYLKELILVFGLGYLGSRQLLTGRLQVNWIDLGVFAYLLYLMALFFVEQNIPLEIRVAGLRSLAMLPCLYLLGRWLYTPLLEAQLLRRLFITLGIMFAVFGLIEAFILPDQFWLGIGHEEYYLMKEGRPIQGRLYLNMYFWDFEQPTRRVASITGDPLLSSYTLAYGLLLSGTWMFSLAQPRVRVGHLVAVLILLATLLTLSRGALLTTVIATVLLIISMRKTAIFSGLIVFMFAVIVGVVFFFGDAFLEVITGWSHVEGLRSGLLVAFSQPFGAGIGLSGNLVSSRMIAMGSTEGILGGGDSYTGSLATQAGIVGLALAYGVFLAMSVCLYQQGVRLRRMRDQSAWIYFATAAMLAGLLVTSTVNESGYSFTASGIIFVIVGLLISAAMQRRVDTSVGTVSSEPAFLTSALRGVI